MAARAWDPTSPAPRVGPSGTGPLRSHSPRLPLAAAAAARDTPPWATHAVPRPPRAAASSEGDSRCAGAEAGPSSSPSLHPEEGGRSYRAAGHGEARHGTASSATLLGSQPGPAGGSAWAAGVSRPAAPPRPPPPSHNHNNMAAAATQSALLTPSRAGSGGARARSGLWLRGRVKKAGGRELGKGGVRTDGHAPRG